MCGIVGVLGFHEVAPVILDALKRLEYRGYDSAGIATIHEGALERRRATGKLINLQDMLVREPLRGFAGIGHTRWAHMGRQALRMRILTARDLWRSSIMGSSRTSANCVAS